MEYAISASIRSTTGKGAARKLRANDMVPAVLYGPKMDPMSLAVPALNLEKLLRSIGEESRLVTLSIGEGESLQTRQVLLREVQAHPYRRRLLHVDFFEAPLDHPIVVNVPIEIKGDSIGVRKGGTLNLILRMLGVRCLPAEIPERIQIDVSSLDLGGTITVAALAGSVPFELVGEPNQAVVSIEAPEGKGSKEAEAARGK